MYYIFNYAYKFVRPEYGGPARIRQLMQAFLKLDFRKEKNYFFRFKIKTFDADSESGLRIRLSLYNI